MNDYNRQDRPRYGAPQSGRFGTAGDNRPRQAAAPRPATRQRGMAPARPALRRPAQPGGRMPKGFWTLAGIGAAILIAGLLLQALMPNGFPLGGGSDKAERPVAAQVSEIHGDGPIRLNEIMSANGGVLVDRAGNTPDWIEVANVSRHAASLKGYILAKSAKAGNVFAFPDVTLQPGECVLVYADSTLQAETGGELHAPFRLSSGGDVLMLFNDADVAVDTVNIPALAENTAYVRKDRTTWASSAQTTPGLLNSDENYRAMTTVTQTAAVQMAEIVASNTRYALDESGVPQDYVLLRNTSSEPVDIGGWYLSDDPQLPRLWQFPSGVVIPGNGTLAVHCSGMNRVENPAHLHTSFRLSTEGETVTLSNAAGQPVDQMTYDLLKTDQACVRGADGSWSVGEPTAQ